MFFKVLELNAMKISNVTHHHGNKGGIDVKNENTHNKTCESERRRKTENIW
jgi:hypothetical protein